MTPLTVVLIVILVLIGFPTVCYMAAKFGTAGYLRAKQREREKTQTKNKEHE